MGTCPGGTALVDAREWIEPDLCGGFRERSEEKCSEWFGGRLVGRVIMTVVFGGSFGIVNPTRWMGSVLRLWMFLPLVPGFPLVCGWLVRVLVVILVVLIVG